MPSPAPDIRTILTYMINLETWILTHGTRVGSLTSTYPRSTSGPYSHVFQDSGLHTVSEEGLPLRNACTNSINNSSPDRRIVYLAPKWSFLAAYVNLRDLRVDMYGLGTRTRFSIILESRDGPGIVLSLRAIVKM